MPRRMAPWHHDLLDGLSCGTERGSGNQDTRFILAP
jgi:hypothetical protein